MELFSKLVPEYEDLPYEEDLQHNRYSFESWWRYLNSREIPSHRRFWIYERALREIPGSYKLWYNYLLERLNSIEGLPPVHPLLNNLENIFERALTYMHKMPRIWELFLNYMSTKRYNITRTRRSFDCALKSLPITQHSRIWKAYIEFVKKTFVPVETVKRVFRRYLRVETNQFESYIDYLVENNIIDEAVEWIVKIIQDDKFISINNQTKHDFWIRLCQLASNYPDKVKLKVEPIIRTACIKFKHEIGPLWVALANYYTRLGFFEKARDIYEDGIETVVTIRDFSVIWDAYIEFEYSIICKYLEKMKNEEKKVPKGSNSILSNHEYLELITARYEDLIERQPLLLSDVVLRQNPHNVQEWHKRISLFSDNPRLQVEQFEKALQTIDPQLALGKLNTIWSRYALLWASLGRIDDARKVFEKGLTVEFVRVEHLMHLWTDYIEMELLEADNVVSKDVFDHQERARKLIQRATATPANHKLIHKVLKNEKDSLIKQGLDASQITVHQRLWKQTKLWALYADLEQSYGTFGSACAVYERMFELKVMTPLSTLNYARYLESHNHFEKSYRVYERGIDLFRFPHAMELWIAYLDNFVNRYAGSKFERTRDIFEQAIEQVPPQFAKLIYLMYAEFEEKYGMARHLMYIYERATRAVPDDQKPGIYNLYIKKAAQWFGITRIRQVFESAIQNIPDAYVRSYSLRYAQLEKKLSEFDRARAIYAHCAQFCDPRSDTEFWKIWKEFEENHGNTDTFKEMLRLRRSVMVQ